MPQTKTQTKDKKKEERVAQVDKEKEAPVVEIAEDTDVATVQDEGYKIEVADLSSFKLDPNNSNLHQDRGRRMVHKSMKERGYARPAVAANDGTLMMGNMSTGEVARATGVGNGKVIVVETDGDIPIIHVRRDIEAGSEEARLLAIEDNRSAEASLLWSQEELAEALNDGLLLEKDLFTEHELGLILEQVEIWGDDEIDKDELDEYGSILAGNMRLSTREEVGGLYNNPNNRFDLPDLRSDMLAPMPEAIKVWAGPDASDLDWDGEWMYNYGTDSIRELDLDRTTLAFYTDDARWERFWYEPEKYVGKMVVSGIKKAVTHNFSLYAEEAAAIHVGQIYHSRWLGRYMQEAGVEVIPDILGGKGEAEDLFTVGLPKYPPCIAFVAQTGIDTQFRKEGTKFMLEILLDKIAPEGIIIYGGSKDFRRTIAGVIPNDVKVLWLASRSFIRNKKVMAGSTSIGGSTV